MKLTPETLAQLETLLDSDAEWWPFAALRPAPHERFRPSRCLLLASLYTIPAILIGALVGRVIGESIDERELLCLAMVVWAVTFTAFKGVVAPFWNRRSDRLSALLERRRQWGASSARPAVRAEPHD